MKEILCLKKNIKKYESGGPFKRVKTCPNGPKVLLIKTYFLEYLFSKRFPAARRCACFFLILKKNTKTNKINKTSKTKKSKLWQVSITFSNYHNEYLQVYKRS